MFILAISDYVVVDALLGHTIAESIVFVPIGGCISVEVWQVHKGGKVGGFRGGGFKCFKMFHIYLPWKATFLPNRKGSSSYNHFSRAMLEFRRVYIYIYFFFLFNFHPYLVNNFLFDSYFFRWVGSSTNFRIGPLASTASGKYVES